MDVKALLSIHLWETLILSNFICALEEYRCMWKDESSKRTLQQKIQQQSITEERPEWFISNRRHSSPAFFSESITQSSGRYQPSFSQDNILLL